MPKKFIGNVKGVGIASAIREYYSSTSASAVVGGTWQSTVPTLDSSHYLWTRLKLTLTNGKVEITDPIREGMFGEEIANIATNISDIKSDQQSLDGRMDKIAPSNVVDVSHGGTGKTSVDGVKSLLGLAKAAFVDLVTVALGGTGRTSHTSNAVLTGNGTNALNNVATGNGAFYATGTNGAAKFGTLPVAQGGTGSTTQSGARTNLGLNDKVFIKHSLNSINIDDTDGNWTVDISEEGHGTVPELWVNVTQTTGGHFITQIAKKCDSAASAKNRNQAVWVRDKYAQGSTAVWSEWREFMPKWTKVWENPSPTSPMAQYANQTTDAGHYNLFLVVFRTTTTVSREIPVLARKGKENMVHAVINIFTSGKTLQVCGRKFTIVDSYNAIDFDSCYVKGMTDSSVSTDDTKLIPVAVYGCKGV